MHSMLLCLFTLRDVPSCIRRTEGRFHQVALFRLSYKQMCSYNQKLMKVRKHALTSCNTIPNTSMS